MEKEILFRKSLAEEKEFEIAEKYFKVIENRTLVQSNSLIIPRYSALPFYQELEADLSVLNCKLINNWQQHQFIADISNWFPYLVKLTPATYYGLSEVNYAPEGSFVLKGATNSKKNLWSTHMFAKNKRAVMDVYCRLLDDSLISQQHIYIRNYVELKNYGFDIQGMPISHEFRCFFYRNKLLAKGFYWAQHIEDIPIVIDDIPESFLQEVASIVSPFINFWVADVAMGKNGEWIVVELNDGQMSGLSCVNPDELYSNLKKELEWQ